MNRILALVLFFTGSLALAAPNRLQLLHYGSQAFPASGSTSTNLDDATYAIDHRPDLDVRDFLNGGSISQNTFPSTAPVARSNGIALVNPRFSGFDGLTHFDTRNAGTGVYTNTQFSLEPPDQGLCAGKGLVMEVVNDVYAIYDDSGALKAGPVAANQFFGLTPAINRVTGVRGDFLSDPRCFYDWSSDRWFLTTLQEDANDPRTHTLIAVSQTGDPLGGWNFFAIDTTNDGLDGTPAHPGCPCFGDQPLLGVNEDAVFITTNEFGATVFNGAQVYAIGKSLFSGGPGSAVLFDNLVSNDDPTPNFYYSIQPATTPPGGKFAKGKKGTEFFASALQFGDLGNFDDRIAVWAMTGTKSLNTTNADVSLNHKVIHSEVYGQPNPATQKAGPTPLGTALGEPLEQLNTNDDRMNQAVYTDGTLWTALNTLIQVQGDSALRTGIAWFRVDVHVDNDVDAHIDSQGYVALAGAHVFFPAIAVNADGRGAISFTVSGADFFPSAAYVVLRENSVSKIHIAAAGTGPEDGFTGYVAYGGAGVARWGDYSAAVAGPDGSIWLATETIPALPRTLLANWGTFVSRVKVGEDDCE